MSLKIFVVPIFDHEGEILLLLDTFMERLEIALTRLSIDLTPLESGQHALSLYIEIKGAEPSKPKNNAAVLLAQSDE